MRLVKRGAREPVAGQRPGAREPVAGQRRGDGQARSRRS